MLCSLCVKWPLLEKFVQPKNLNSTFPSITERLSGKKSEASNCPSSFFLQLLRITRTLFEEYEASSVGEKSITRGMLKLAWLMRVKRRNRFFRLVTSRTWTAYRSFVVISRWKRRWMLPFGNSGVLDSEYPAVPFLKGHPASLLMLRGIRFTFCPSNFFLTKFWIENKY